MFAGNLRIAKITAQEVIYFHKDHLGSSTVMTDENGSTLETTEYLPFGSNRSQRGIVQSGYKFTDQEIDSESGLYNYDARLYDPVVGRFISADTVVPGAFNPQALNRYSYCINNPLIYVDPTGHWFGGVESDPSDFDIDYNNNNNGQFTDVDAHDGDDPGESGWDYDNDSNEWVDNRVKDTLKNAGAAAVGCAAGLAIIAAPQTIVAAPKQQVINVFQRVTGFFRGIGRGIRGIFSPSNGARGVFTNGEIFEKTIQTSKGSVDLMAQTVIKGNSLHLKDVAIFGRSKNALTGLTREVVRAKNALVKAAKKAGFKELRISGSRHPTASTSANPGKIVDLTIDLTK